MERWFRCGCSSGGKRFYFKNTRGSTSPWVYIFYLRVFACCLYVCTHIMWMFMKNRRLTTSEVTVSFYPPDLFLGTKAMLWKSRKSSEPLSQLPSYCIFLSYQWNKSISSSSQNLSDHVAPPKIVVMCQWLTQLWIKKDGCFLLCLYFRLMLKAM